MLAQNIAKKEHKKFMKTKHTKKAYKHFETQGERKAEKKKALIEQAEAGRDESRAQVALQLAKS